LYADSLVVNWDHEGKSFLTVLDTKTGKPRWKVDRDEITSWATPLVVDRNGVVQIIVNATKRTTSYDLASGKIFWQCGGQTTNAIPSPVRFDDMAIAMSGFRGTAAYAIPLGSSGDITDTDRIAWHHQGGTPYVPSPVLVGDRLYFTKGLTAVLTCLNARTGKPLMESQRLSGLNYLYASGGCQGEDLLRQPGRCLAGDQGPAQAGGPQYKPSR